MLFACAGKPRGAACGSCEKHQIYGALWSGALPPCVHQAWPPVASAVVWFVGWVEPFGRACGTYQQLEVSRTR